MAGSFSVLRINQMRQQRTLFEPILALCTRKRSGTAYPDHLSPRLRQWLIFSQRDVCEKRSVADDRGIGISLDIRPPLPTRGIRMASSDIFGLETFEFLLVAKLVGLVSRTAELARVRD